MTNIASRLRRRAHAGWNWLLQKPERLTALSTLAIFVATAVAAVVGIAQWSALRSTDGAIHGQMNLMAADQRPWLSAPKISAGKNGSLEFIFRNVGKTPTRGLFVDAKFVSHDADWRLEIARICSAGKDSAAKNEAIFRLYSISPGEDFVFSDMPSGSFTKDNRALFDDAKEKLIVGCVVYKIGTGFEASIHKTGILSFLSGSKESIVVERTYTIDPD